MDSTWTILLAGDLRPTPRLRAQVAGSRVIAADAGIRHATALDLQPELWIGDFDSATEALKEQFAHVPRQPHPADKDATDGALAVAHALANGAGRVMLAGALHGRTDHALAHLLQLADLAERGVSAVASSGREEAHGLIPGRRQRIDLPAGTPFSLLGFGPLRNVHVRNARWELSGEDIPFASTRPLSNIAAGPVEITIGAGPAVLLARPAGNAVAGR